MRAVAVAYIRVSKEKADGYSPETQLRKIREYCRMRDWVIVEEFRDLDESGRKEDRPDFQRMIEFIKNEGGIDYVVVYRVDRFSRSTKDFLYYLDILEKHGCNLVSVNESFDASTPFGRAMVSMLAVFAQLESDAIGERIRDNLAHAVRQRKIHLGARPPYGYTRQKGRLTVHPEQAKHVRWIYQRYWEGEGTRTLARQLTEAHVPTPTGRRVWRYTTVQTILENPVYAGYISWNGEVIPGEHEPIIAPGDWAQVQELIRARAGGPRSTGEGSALGRLLHCGLCGARGNIRYSHQRHQQRYICSTRAQSARTVCANISLDASSLERAIVRRLLSHVDASHLRRELELAKRSMLSDTARLDEVGSVQRRRETIKSAIDRLFADHYEHNIITREQFIEANNRYQQELREIDARLQQLNSAQQAVLAREADVDVFLQRLNQLTAWDDMTPTERRATLAPLIKRIVWWPDRAVMHLQFGERVELPYFELHRHVAYFDDEHWPVCPTCGERFKRPAGLASHRRRWGH